MERKNYTIVKTEVALSQHPNYPTIPAVGGGEFILRGENKTEDEVLDKLEKLASELYDEFVSEFDDYELYMDVFTETKSSYVIHYGYETMTIFQAIEETNIETF